MNAQRKAIAAKYALNLKALVEEQDNIITVLATCKLGIRLRLTVKDTIYDPNQQELPVEDQMTVEHN